VDDLADAQEELLKGSVVVVQVHQTDAEKHFIQTGTTMRRDRQHMENFYYAAVYDLLQDEIRYNTYAKFRQLKAQIARLYDTPQRRQYVDIDELDTLDGEEPSLYQQIRQKTVKKHV
jgi:hypothetical protein